MNKISIIMENNYEEVIDALSNMLPKDVGMDGLFPIFIFLLKVVTIKSCKRYILLCHITCTCFKGQHSL